MKNIDLDDIEIVVKAISANDGTVPCDYCPLDFNISNCLGDYLYRRLK